MALRSSTQGTAPSSLRDPLELISDVELCDVIKQRIHISSKMWIRWKERGIGLLVQRNGRLTLSENYYREPNLFDAQEYRDPQSFIYRAIQATEDVNRHRSFCFQGRCFALSTEGARRVIDLYQKLFQELMELEKSEHNAEWVIAISNSVYNVTPISAKS